MKKILFIFFVVSISLNCFSQYDTTPPYLKTKTLPQFSLLNIDSVAFSQTILEGNKNTILMLFNPTCEHCRKQMELFLSMSDLPQLAQLVLISIETLEKTKRFYKKYHLEKYPFIHIGKDYKHFFVHYLDAATIPILAFYNKHNAFVLYKQGNATEAEIRETCK